MDTYKTNPNIIGKTISALIDDVENSFGRMFSKDKWNEGETVPVNLAETERSYEMYVMAPGLKKEDFTLHVDDDVLHVGYDEKENEDSTRKWLRKEYKLKTFRRSFTLNNKVKVPEIAAKYENGVLIVTLPKKEDAINREQKINVD